MKKRTIQKSKKQFLSFLLLAALLVPMCSAASATNTGLEEGIQFVDIAEDSPYYWDIKTAYEYGLMAGTSGSRFDAERRITRAMWITVLYRMSGQQPSGDAEIFSDVQTGNWFAPAVAWAAAKGIISTETKFFSADSPITYRDMAQMSAKFAALYFGESLQGNLSTADEPEAALEWMMNSRILQVEDGTPEAEQTVNRGTAAGIAVRLYSLGVTVLPKLTADNLHTIMAERLVATKNEETVVPMLWQGVLQMDVEVGSESRTVKLYIPKNIPQGSTFVMLNVPEGEETLPFLRSSGWMQKADEERICLLVAEPSPGGWKTPGEEQPYLQACYQAEKTGLYFRGSLGMYLVGYGEIGTGIHKLVMADPLFAAAAVFMDASNIDSGYVNEYQNKSYNTESRTFDVGYKDVPVPVWISSETVDDQTKAAIDYWKAAARVSETATKEKYGQVYSQAGETMFTPEGNIVKVAVETEKHDYNSPATTNMICDFMFQYYRCGAGGPGANLLCKKVDYKAMGVDFRRFTDSNGIDREYMVYVPASCKNHENVPVVVNFHGQYSSMRNAFEESMWYALAEENGFIIVVPESTLVALNGDIKAYRPRWQLENADMRYTDVEYINELLDRLSEEYPVDESRIYCTGHSMGIMLANYMAGDETSHRFAAIGGTSSGQIHTLDKGGAEKIPFFLSVGQYDLWDYKLTESNVITVALDFWLRRNGLAAKDTVGGIRASGASEEYQDGCYHNYLWKDTAGIPLVRYMWVEKKDHMNTPSENRLLWDEFFSKWELGEDGVRYYEGMPVA